jgi:hypothetical protein
VKLAQLSEQGISAPLWGGQSLPQDLEANMIHSFSLFISFRINLFITLDSMLQKKSSGVEPHYLDVWFPAHDGDGDATEKLVSNNIKCYA